jgi:hypothetical protein
MPINKFTTLLDLARQAKILTGETATFDGKIQVGIPFSGYPTGVDTGSTVSLGVVSSEDAVFSGNTGTTVFDVSNPLSPNYNALFSGYTATTWSNPLFSGNTSGLTLPITPFSADTQTVGPFWTLTQTGMTGDYVIGTQYTGYSVTYSFFQIDSVGTGGTEYSGFTTASQENFSAGTLDYKGPLDYLSTKEDATVEGRLTTNKITITNGASASTIGYVLTQTGENGEGEWLPNSSADTNTYVTGGTLTGTDLTLDWNTGGSATPISLSGLSDTFTGNTSGDCINDIYVKNIHSCSPLFVNPNDEGNVYFGSTSGVTINFLPKLFVGIGTNTPNQRLHVEGGDLLVKDTDGKFYTDIQNSIGPLTLLSGGTTGLTRLGVITPTYDAVTFGVRGSSEPIGTGYGKQGDGFIGFNIISQPGTGTDDYIRFFAGQASGAAGTPDLYIQGSGATRGYVGFNTGIPRKNVDIIGDGILSGELTIETINTGTSVYLLAATSGGTIIQGNDLYSDICSFCSSEVSGDTTICTGSTEISTINADTGGIDCTSVYGCTQWCAYESNGNIIATTTDYETSTKYRLSGYITKCCDAGSADGGTDYGTSISASTTTSGDTPPTVITGLTRPFVIRKVKKIGFLNTHKSDILNSNQITISNSTLGRIELSTLSFIESSFNSSLYSSYLSGIIASENGFISNSGNATIIGSQYSTLSGVTGSTIIGGNNITGTENDTVYVPKLNIDTLGGGTSINNLGIDVNGNVVVGTAGGGTPEATTATTTTINFTGQTIYYNAGSPGTGNISEDLTGAKLGLIQKIYHNDGTEPTYPAGWVLMGDAIYFTSTLNIIYAEWAGGSRVEYWYVQEQ